MDMNAARAYYAHTKGDDERNWEPLEEHLREVARLAEQFAFAFDSSDWGRLAGLWHDLGKYHPRFQERLRDESIRQSHAGAGAVHWRRRVTGPGQFAAFAIAGHHSGLMNFTSSEGVQQRPLTERLHAAERTEYDASAAAAAQEILNHPVPGRGLWSA